MKQNPITQFIRPDLLCFDPYRSARDETINAQVFMNANELPYDYEWQGCVKLNRYPEKQSAKTINKIAKLFNVETNQIVLGRGSDEMMELVIRLFCTPFIDTITICPPTYGMYSIYASLQGAKIVEIPLLKENKYQLDMDGLLNAEKQNIKIIFLCSPNNPTGNLLNKNDIITLCKAYSNKSIIVVDEAYIEFSDTVSLSAYINQFDNLIILRTFSKAFGLAGARLGCLLANKYLVEWMLKIISPYPLPAFIYQLADDALSPKRLLQIKEQVSIIKNERKLLFYELKKIPCVKHVWPSDANFLLFETDDAKKVMNFCVKNGFLLRYFTDKKGLKNCIRMSVGLPKENVQLIKLLREI